MATLTVSLPLNSKFENYVVNAKALSIKRCQDDINTEHNMKSIGHAAVAQWTKRLTRNGQTRVRIREAHIFDITIIIMLIMIIDKSN